MTNQAEALKQLKKRTPRELLEFRFLFKPLKLGNLAFRNVDGLRFIEQSEKWGFDHLGISHGMALADLDNDGDLDVAVNNFNSSASVYRNNSVAPRISVSLRGDNKNTTGVGARITVDSPNLKQSQELISGGRYLSGDATVKSFAATKPIDRITIAWPSGNESRITKPKPNRHYLILESAAVPANQAISPEASLFADASELLNHRHTDREFDDFSRQQLLPKKLSQEGPGVAWIDWNTDGFDDAVVTTGAGGSLAIFLNDKKGGFNQAPHNMPRNSSRDQLSLLELKSAAEGIFLLQSNYEDGLAVGSSIESWTPDGMKKVIMPAGAVSFSTICSADYDGDGNEDIYLAQNFFDVERETSRHDAGLGQVLLGNGNGEFRALTRLQSGVAALGQARACVVSDFNGDGRVDIATTQNNDRTLVYLNQGGQFGLRVFLVGTQKNPTAVGATLTLISEGNSGPKREIRLGSGYLSQDGLGQVFTTADKESVLRVQWPSGDSAEYKLPNTAKTITISEKGGIHVVQ